MANVAKARAALEQWVSEVGSAKSFRLAAGASARLAGVGSRTRVGAVARVGGVDRLVMASGGEALQLATGLATVGRKRRQLSAKSDIADELRKAPGAAVLYLRGEPPLRAAVFSLSGTSALLSLDGIVLPLADQPLLAGPPAAAGACEGAQLFCARAGLGAAGKAALAAAIEQLARLTLGRDWAGAFSAVAAQMAAALDGPVVLRVPLPDLRKGGEPQWAVPVSLAGPAPGFTLPAREGLPTGAQQTPGRFTLQTPRPICVTADGQTASLGDDCGATYPAPVAAAGEVDSVARFDTPALSRALADLSPLDALSGALPASAFTAKLLVGRLIAGSGPLTARARPAEGQPNAARVELRWPLR